MLAHGLEGGQGAGAGSWESKDGSWELEVESTAHQVWSVDMCLDWNAALLLEMRWLMLTGDRG